MSANRLNDKLPAEGKFATDLATRMRTTLSIGAVVAASCFTALGAWSAWQQAGSEDAAATRAWGDLERQRIEMKLEHSVAIGESIAHTLAAAQGTTDPMPLAIAQSLLDSRRIGLEGATLTVIDAHGATMADSAGMRRDLREHVAVLDMISTRKIAAEADRDGSGREAAVMIALPVLSRDDARLAGGVVVRLPLAALLAGGSLNAGNAALASRQHSLARGTTFAASNTFPLHLDAPLDRLGLRLEMATRPLVKNWSLALVVAGWVLAGVLLGVVLIATARWTSRFILAVALGAPGPQEAQAGNPSPKKATILQLHGQPRAVING